MSASMSDSVQVLLQRLENYPPEWPLPAYMTAGAAAVDLRNAGPSITVPPLGRHLVPTGLAMAIPEGYEAQVRPRSGLSIKQGLTLVNAPGTIDSDYRGEVRVAMVNLDAAPQEIAHGERVAQLVLARYARIEWAEVPALPSTERGAGGFGSTGR